MKRLLSIGGTGMLGGATIALAAQSDEQVVVARRASRFVKRNGLAHAEAIDVDWNDPSYPARIEAALAVPPDLAVLWREPGHALGRLHGMRTRVIIVLGTGAGGVEERIARHRDAAREARLLFVALGSKPTATGRRWLTHEEISAGVIECAATDRDVTVGGYR